MFCLHSLTKTMQERFGADLSLLMARAPAWGNVDACIIVFGPRHEDATLALIVGLAATGATKFKTEVLKSCGFRSIPPYTYTTLSFQP